MMYRDATAIITNDVVHLHEQADHNIARVCNFNIPMILQAHQLQSQISEYDGVRLSEMMLSSTHNKIPLSNTHLHDLGDNDRNIRPPL